MITWQYNMLMIHVIQAKFHIRQKGFSTVCDTTRTILPIFHTYRRPKTFYIYTSPIVTFQLSVITLSPYYISKYVGTSQVNLGINSSCVMKINDSPPPMLISMIHWIFKINICSTVIIGTVLWCDIGLLNIYNVSFEVGYTRVHNYSWK